MIHGLAEVRRALCRDGSHVVLVAEPPADGELGSRLASEICDAGRVEIAHLAKLEPAAATRHLLAALGVPSSGAEPELRARAEIERLAKLDASIVLIIPEALSVETHVLRQLGELSRMSGKVLRLAFLVERNDAADRDPAARIVGSLGTGAAKIELFARRPGEDAGVAALPQRKAPMPPVVPATAKPRRPRPIAVRAGTRKRRGSFRSRTLALVALLALFAAPTLIFTEASPPEFPELTKHVAARAPVPLAAPTEVPALPEIGALPEVAALPDIAATLPTPKAPRERPAVAKMARVDAALLPEPAPPPVLEPPPAKPVRRAMVQVSFNAAPWADLEVDGRAVGLTPIAGLPLEKGLRRVRATFPDGRVVERELQVDEFQNRFRIE